MSEGSPLLCEKKRFGPAQATFFRIFDLNAGVCANVCGSPQPERGLWEPLEAFGSFWEPLYRILQNPSYMPISLPQERPAAICGDLCGEY